MNRTSVLLLLAFMTAASGLTLPFAGILWQAAAHEGHEQFSAGEPGNPNRPSRTVKISMLEDGKKMLFEPAKVEVPIWRTNSLCDLQRGNVEPRICAGHEGRESEARQADGEVPRNGT